MYNNVSVKQIEKVNTQNIIVSYTFMLLIISICALVLLHTGKRHKITIFFLRGLALFALLGLALMAFLAITI